MKKVFLTSALIVVIGLLIAGTSSFSQQGKGKGKMGGNTSNSKFVDANGDGICDNFVDANGDGVCDNCGQNSSGKMGGNRKFIDANGDGICDNFVDANGDGVCDNCTGSGYGHHGCAKGKGMGLCNNNYQNNMIQKYEFSDQVTKDLTKVTFNLKENADVKLNIYDRNGNLIENVYSGKLGTGTHSIDLNTNNFKTGIYFYNLLINGQSIVREISIVK
ncbi:MAG: T9SS type A sorting domain-containing protein [Candidatus Kapaibacteriota bacterium]